MLRAALRFAVLVSAVLGAAGTARALEYLSVAEAAVGYDTPSRQGRPLWIVLAQTPVELIVGTAGWSKVRDSEGSIFWLEQQRLVPRRTVIVNGRAEVRQRPEAAAPVVFEADNRVILELLEATPPGWAKVRHRDGQTGFVRVLQVWGT